VSLRRFDGSRPRPLWPTPKPTTPNVFNGEPLAQLESKPQADLRRRRRAIEGAIEKQKTIVVGIESRVATEVCDAIEPLAHEKIGAVIAAFDGVAAAIGDLEAFDKALRSKGIKARLRPPGWEVSPIEHQLMVRIEPHVTNRRESLRKQIA